MAASVSLRRGLHEPALAVADEEGAVGHAQLHARRLLHGPGIRVCSLRFWGKGVEFTVECLGFGVKGVGFTKCLGFGVLGLGFGVWGLGFGVWGLGFGVWGLLLR